MSYLVGLMSILLPVISFAAGEKLAGASSANLQQAIVGQGARGELVYIVTGADGKSKQVNMSFFVNGLETAIESAKKVVCEMNVLPQSVTVSSVVVSVTYDTKQFCPKKQ